jgi:TrmH family RNA methyltransferase
VFKAGSEAQMNVLSSRQNPHIKAIHALATSAAERRNQQKTLLDGIHLIKAAHENKHCVDALFVSERGLKSPEIAALVAQLQAHLPCTLLNDSLFNYISPSDSPTGILAVIAYPEQAQIQLPQQSCIVLEAVQDTGNLGTILRTAAAAGISDIYLSEGCTQAWSPKVLRAAMGAHFKLKIYEKIEIATLLKGFTGQVLATGLQQASSLYEVDLRQKNGMAFWERRGRAISTN